MDSGEAGDRRHPTPVRVSLAHIASPSPRRLSSCFAEPGRPAPLAGKKVAWLSLQGRLVGAGEATSAAAIGGGLGREEAVAWELFSPIHRVVVVAAIATASRRSRKIAQLQRSIELRDELLLRMQQKLDNLCEQMNSLPDQVGKCIPRLSSENNQIDSDVKLAHNASQNCCSTAPLQELNPESGIGPLCKNMPSVLHSGKDTTEVVYPKEELFNMGNSIIMEQEERRISDLSDFSWSVTSSVDLQLSTLATEQEFYNLRKECEEKDLKIEELVSATHAIKLADSKRITELEEAVKRKNLVISNLKKDMDVLEKQVVELTRLRRGSSATSNDFSAALDSNNMWPTPVMATNILYDMSSTSPSSSDPESPVNSKDYHSRFLAAKATPPHNDTRTVEMVRNPLKGSLVTLNKAADSPPKQQSISPLKENQRIQRSQPVPASRQRRLAYSSEGVKKNRSAAPHKANYLSARRRWS